MPTYTQKSRTISINSPLGEDVLLVRSISGTETLGRPFSYDVDLVSEDAAIDLNAMLGANVTVRIARDNGNAAPRLINGIVSRFSRGETTGTFTEYRATVVPWWWFLSRTTDCRIFQGKKVTEIIDFVCKLHVETANLDAGRLSGTYDTWENCVQYQETALDFITRLMEQEGISYYVKHEDGKHTMVLCDNPNSHDAVPEHATVRYNPDEESDYERLWSWDIEHEAQPGAFMVKDFNFKTPTTDIGAVLSAPKGHDLSEFERYEYPAEYEEFGQGETLAKVRLQELHARSVVVSGEGDVRMMHAGGTFTLEQGPDTEPKEVMVVACSIRAVQDLFQTGQEQGDDLFTCRVRAIPKATNYRPPRVTPKPIIPGPQTATVVGKTGEEIDPDEHGRVRVLFHWDRWVGSSPDAEKGIAALEAASCWVRVSQAWAGKSWGMISIPRVGQEVVVSFLDGDPDRPLITGRVYNAVNKPPYELPGFKTISTFKTNSSKGGGGFNELRFEDKAGEEQVFLHGQRNLDIRVLNDRFEWIGNDRHLIVKHDKFEHVDNDRHEKVVGHHHEAIDKDRHLKVGGKEALETVETRSLKVGKDVLEEFGANHKTTVTQQRYLKADHIALEADTNITLYVGESWIAINSEGIKLSTTGKIVLEATGAIEQKSKTDKFTIEAPMGDIAVKSSMGKVEVTSVLGNVKMETTAGMADLKSGTALVTIKGTMVMIN